jgi:flagellar biosynthesis protein FlhG
MARYDSQLGELALAELKRFRPRVAVNYVRLRHDGELGPDACDMARRYLGVSLDYVGHIEQDDSVWLSVVRRRPVLIDSPTSKSARNIERIARRVLALASNKQKERVDDSLSLIDFDPTHYDVLFTHRGASEDELRRAHRRLKEIYQPGSLALTSLLSPEQLLSERARIDEASDTLLDAVKRRAYDV